MLTRNAPYSCYYVRTCIYGHAWYVEHTNMYVVNAWSYGKGSYIHTTHVRVLTSRHCTRAHRSLGVWTVSANFDFSAKGASPCSLFPPNSIPICIIPWVFDGRRRWKSRGKALNSWKLARGIFILYMLAMVMASGAGNTREKPKRER